MIEIDDNQNAIKALKNERIKTLFERFSRGYVLDIDWVEKEKNFKVFEKTEIYDILEAYDQLELDNALLRGRIEALGYAAAVV